VRYDHRLAGDNFGGIFAHVPGASTRLSATFASASHVGGRKGTDLYAAYQLAAVRRNRRSGSRLQVIRRPRSCLRRCGIRNYGDYYRAELCSHDGLVELAKLCGDTRCVGFTCGRCVLLDLRTVHKISGTAVYLTKNPFSTPPAFLYMLKHNGIIHKRIIFLSIGYKRVPYVPADKRINIQKLRDGFYRVIVRYGFMNRTDIQAAMRALNNQSRLKIDMEDTTFFVWREILLPSKSVGMSRWRDILYLLMNRNSERISTFFNIPPDKVFEIGAQIKF
jgi:hypothetical protein